METLNGKTILVCGGAGFIGSNFIHHILGKYPRVRLVNLDKLTYSGNLDNLKDIAKDKRYVFVKGDIASGKTVAAVFQKFKPDYCINFAAETHVDRSIHVGSLEFIKTNIQGVFNILEEVKKQKNILKYVQVSTDETFGTLSLDSKEKFREDTAFKPNVPYAATKAGGDLLCHAYHSTWKVPVIVTHCSNNYGPYQYPEKLIPFFTVRMLEGKKLPLYGDGKNVRDWIFVSDHCRALALCLLKGRAGEVYNIGADNELSNLQIAKMIARQFGRDESCFEFVPDRPGHDRRYGIDSAKIRQELGWQPIYSFERAFKETVAWYKNHTAWVEKIQKKTGVFNPHIDLWETHLKKLKNIVPRGRAPRYSTYSLTSLGRRVK